MNVSDCKLMKFFAIGLALAVFGLAAADPRDFTVQAEPVFQSNSYWPGSPIYVSLENRGPNARGSVSVMDDSGITRYPVELPTGAKKRVMLFPASGMYGMQPEIWLNTDQARFQIPFLSKGSYGYGQNNVVALVSDSPGELGFFRQSTRGGGNELGSMVDAYLKPEDAPERPVGYRGLFGVILGEGSERLSDVAIEALYDFTLSGGTLMIIGGASARTLMDPRLQNLLPASDFHTQTVQGSARLTEVGGFPFSEPLTIARGTPKPGAKWLGDGNVPMFLERNFGLGRVIVWSFNPFEEPLNRWGGKRRMFSQYIRPVEAQRIAAFLNQYTYSDPYGYDYSVSTTGGRGPTPYSSNVPQDPFNVQLPGPSKVFWILASFFVVVVPVNFIVLRKLGRGELAWITAPIISLVFAGLFLNQASDLYSASLSTRTTGALLMQAGHPESVFIGTTQMFFPNGGSYDLKVRDIDQLSTARDEYGMSSQSRSQVNPVDTGTVFIPDLRAANLAFEQISYVQRYKESPKIQLNTKVIPGGQFEITVSNGTTEALKNAAIMVSGRQFGLKQLEPGAKTTIKVNAAKSKATGQSALVDITSRQNTLILACDYTGLRPGPQLGQAAADQSHTRLILVSPLPAEKER